MKTKQFRELFYVWLAVLILSIAFIANGVAALFHKTEADNQQRQIDQLCQAMVLMAQQQGALDTSGLTSGGGKTYCLIFADYNRSRAIVGEFDGEINYDKKPRLIIIHNVDKKILEDWDNQPLSYGYKRIPI